MITINVDKSKTYLLACSFGPDSMMLFDALRQNGINFICCHVNYHKRDVSNFEEQSLKNYCLKYNIGFELFDTLNMTHLGNFQAWARNIRYEFFYKMYQKYNAAGLFVAHQQDDVIETYLMQKKRHAHVGHYGLLLCSSMNNMIIYRPLLDLSKKELEQYDKSHNIPYSIDVSNLTNDYERNRIRHALVEKLSKKERDNIINEIKQKNIDLEIKKKQIQLIKLTKENILEMDEDLFALSLFSKINKYGIYALSMKTIKQLKELSKSSKSNIMVKLADDIFYCQEYGDIYIYKKKEPYSYIIDKPGQYTFNEFTIDFSSATDRNIHSSDYPLTIRSYKSNDKMKIKNYYVNVNRLFLDWKMPMHLRQSWPLVINNKNEIIYIPRYRKQYIDKHQSKFLITL